MSITKSMEKVANLQIVTGLTQREIAKKLDINESTISRWQKNPEYINHKLELEKKYLSFLASKAIRTLNDLLDDDNGNVRLGAAKDILDRTGFKLSEKQEISIKPIIISGSDELED